MNPGAYDGYQAERAEVRLAGAAGSTRPSRVHCLDTGGAVAQPGCTALHKAQTGRAAAPACIHRLQLMEAFSTPGCNAVVLAGDSHNAWAHELLDERGRR